MGSLMAWKGDGERSGLRVVLFAGVGSILLGALLAFGALSQGNAGASSLQGGEFDRGRAFLGRGTALLLASGGILLGSLILRGAWRARSEVHGGSPRAENASAALAFAGLLGLAWCAGAVFSSVPSQASSDASDAYHVEVLARQFEWIVRYPGPDGKLGGVALERVHHTLNPVGLDPDDPAARDDIVRRGLLRLPIRRTCVIHLRSLDVIHGFNVHAFRVKHDILPGYPTQVVCEPSEIGVFELSCASICGLGHYRMRGKVEVSSEEDLESWLAREEAWL